MQEINFPAIAIALRDGCLPSSDPGTLSYGQKTRPDRCPAPEIIALRTLMITQAREVFC